MLTGNPPLSHLEPEKARLKIAFVNVDIVATLPGNVSQDAKEFIMAALTRLVLLIAESHKWLCS